MTARVLIVDDLPPNIQLLETRLLAEYFDVASVTNGADALARCREGGCDIVLLDVMMPGMDGFEVCARLKADPATMHLPVVMVTARARGFRRAAPVQPVALSRTHAAAAHSAARRRR